MTETFTFRVIARRETEYWDETYRRENRIEEVLSLYLIRPGERTHICSLTPNSRVMFLRRAVFTDVCLERGDRYDALTPEQLREIESIELDAHGEEPTDYIGFIDFDKFDLRWAATPFDVEPYEVSDGDDPWEIAHEWETANPADPDICTPAVFTAWAAEQRAKRRAENVPPCEGSHHLPLFVAAADPVYRDVCRRFGITPGQEGEAPWDRLREAHSVYRANLAALGWTRG